MSEMLTLTQVVENKFRKFARNSGTEALCGTNAILLRDTVDENDELTGNSIRVISRTVSVHDAIEHSLCEPGKGFNDKEFTQNLNEMKTDQKNVDKPNSGRILCTKASRNRQYETGDDSKNSIDMIVPKNHGKYGREYNHSLNKDIELHLDHQNPTEEYNRSLPLQKRSDRTGGKVLAYRPGTKVDNFRRDYQYTFPDKENIVEGLDVEEGNKIWNEVEQIIDKTDSKIRKNISLPERFCGSYYSCASSKCVSDLKSAGNSRSSLNSIEFCPRFNSRSHKQPRRLVNKIWSFKGLQSDTDTKNNNSIINSENVSKLSNIFADDVKKEGLPEKWTGLINNIWSTEDVKIGLNRNQAKRSNLGRLYWSDVQGECKDKSVTMTTMLPRIAPPSTPLPTGLTQPPPRSHSSASMYVPYPPKELSSSIDFVRIPGRINPLAPPPPRRRINWSWETTDQHYENEKRSLLMQKREHTRYHSAWSKAFYGAPAEKEAYRRHYREVLKQQMSDKNAMAKEEFKEKIKETEQAISYDKTCRMNDAQEYYRKHSYLMQYRDGNKQQMEDRWAQTRQNRDTENRIDRERLRYNPINWSCTLK